MHRSHVVFMVALLIGGFPLRWIGGEIRAEAESTAAQDQPFVSEAGAGGLAAVELARLALERSSNSHITSLAQQLLADHDRINHQLVELAERKRLAVPSGVDAQHKSAHATLALLSGGEFDHAYIAETLEAHQAAVRLFRNEMERGQDSDLRAWAEKVLPTLQMHLEMVQQTKRS